MDAAREVRQFSNCSTKLGAVLEKSGRILAVASNKQGSMTNGRTTHEYSRHAETSLLLNKVSRDASVYVYRAHQRTGEPLLAKPCSRCQEWLRSAGVKKVYYTVPGGWEEMKL